MFLFYPAGILPGAAGGVCYSTHSFFPLIARNFESYKQLLHMDRGKCALRKGHCPPEELDSPEALGKLRHRKGVILYITRSYSLHLLISRSVCMRTKNGGS